MTIDQYSEAFISEAKSHIKLMNETLIHLEKNPHDSKQFHEIFRAVHTIKSLAATMGYQQMVDLCHAMEDLLSAFRNKIITLPSATEILFQCFDHISASLKNLSAKKK